MDATKFERIVTEYYGTVTAQNDTGLTRVQFQNYPKAAGFYDEMYCRHLDTRFDSPTTVLVQL